MPRNRVGNITIERVIEFEGPALSLYGFIPDATRDLVEREFRWMAPTLLDDKLDNMINVFQSFIFRTKHHTILCDTCNGNHRSGRKNPYWDNREFPYMENFLATGYKPQDIDIVMCTHLHGDHVGWNTHLKDGQWVPTFPNAVHLVSEPEMGAMEERLTHGPQAYYEDSIKPIIDAGKMRLVSLDHVIDDQAWLEESLGHTIGHVSLRIRDGGAEGVIVGDAIHHPIQVYFPEWNARGDTHPELARATRRRILEESLQKGTLVLPNHFAPFRVKAGPRGYEFELEPGAP